MIRGVAFKVPHVMSCLTAFEPIWSAVGEGTLGTSGKVGDFGRSARTKLKDRNVMGMSLHGVPSMAASIRLWVGLEGTERLCFWLSMSCSGRRVLLCLTTLGTASGVTEILEVDGS